MKKTTCLRGILCVLAVSILATLAQARIELHYYYAATDPDSAYEIAGIESPNGDQAVVLSAIIYGSPWNLSNYAERFLRGPSGWYGEVITYGWTALTSNAQTLQLQDDEVSSPLSLGFTKTFYSGTYNTVRVSSNGFVSFTSTSHGCCAGQNIPDTTEPNAVVAGVWEDLLPASAGGEGTIRYEAFVNDVPKKFIVEFSNVAHWGYAGYPVTFQIVIFEDL